jgi:hypothetical protein
MYLKRSDYILHTPLDARAEGITNPKSTMVHVYQCCPKNRPDRDQKNGGGELKQGAFGPL